MKCDELKAETIVPQGCTITLQMYPKAEVDASIAELKARIQLDDDEMAGFLQLEEECGGGDLRNYIAELNAKLAEKDKEIAELKKKLMPCLNGDCILTCEVVEKYGKENAELKQKLEDAKASHYAEIVDAGMRERRLRRALWHAIALFCARSCEYFNGIMSHCLMGQDDLYKRCEEKKNKYIHAMYKCRAKEKEYK